MPEGNTDKSDASRARATPAAAPAEPVAGEWERSRPAAASFCVL